MPNYLSLTAGKLRVPKQKKSKVARRNKGGLSRNPAKR